MRPLDFLSMAALSFITAYGLWQIAIRQPDPIQVRIIDLPPVTEAALLTSGIDRQTLSEYLELKTTVPMGSAPSTASTLSTPVLILATQKEVIPPVPAGRTKPSSPAKHLVQKARATTLTKAQLAAEVRAALPKLTAAEVEAAVWIIWRESGGRLAAKNPRSSSHGLNGFISRSWVSMTKRHGIKHSLAPRAQILALYHYCNDRYGSMSAARSFHRKRGWY